MSKNIYEDVAETRDVSFPVTPAVHKTKFYYQLADGNQLYDSLLSVCKNANNAATSNSPHFIASLSPSWTHGNEEYELGIFTSSTGWEYPKNGSTGKDIHIQIYNDTSRGRDGIASFPQKPKVIIEPRRDGMWANGSPFTWPSGIDGTSYQGTLIKGPSSYVSTPYKRLEQVREVVSAGFDKPLSEYGKVIPETFRFGNVEAYIRFDKPRLESVIEELKSSKKLLKSDGFNGSGSWDIKKGDYRIWRFTSDEVDALGFKNNENSDSIKAYLFKNHDQYPESHQLHHPKLEVVDNGTYHFTRWKDIVSRCRRIVLSHAYWAGLDEDDYITSEYIPAQEFTIGIPTERKNRLREYWCGHETKRSIRGRIHHSQTQSDKDILTILLYETGALTYDGLAERTAWTKRTVRDRVAKMTDDNILRRNRSACTMVDFKNQYAKDIVKSVLRDTKTVKEHLDEVEERKQDRARKELNKN